MWVVVVTAKAVGSCQLRWCGVGFGSLGGAGGGKWLLLCPVRQVTCRQDGANSQFFSLFRFFSRNL